MTDKAKHAVKCLRESAEFQWCSDCNASDGCGDAYKADCHYTRMADLIESLSAELTQVKRERDAAVEDLWGVCRACIHYNDGKIICCCKFEECTHGADDWDSEDHWQWRGVKEE